MDITLIGAGPRNLMVLERLITWQRDRLPRQQLDILMVDPYGIGGRVWDVNQDPNLIMNTAASQISLFYDQSASSPGPSLTGANLADWAGEDAITYIRTQTDLTYPEALIHAATHLGENGYAPRALYGLYLRWGFAELQRRAAKGVTIAFKPLEVTGLTKTGERFQLTAEQTTWTADKVVMALGNLKNTLTRDQAALFDHAKRHDLFYVEPGFPAEGQLERIAPDEPVIMRGLGLSFFDFVSRLTEGRGGEFATGEDGMLVYHPSGKEPKIYAGSRRGFPYHAKGRNEKGPGELVQPQFLTDEQLRQWQKEGELSGNTMWTALQHEVEYIYYQRLIVTKYQDIDVATFENDFVADPDHTIENLKIDTQDRLDWQQLEMPFSGQTDTKDYQQFMQTYLHDDVIAADAGTKTGPLTSALEVLRDLRTPIRAIVERQLLSEDQYLDFFLRWFNGLNDFLSIGPPVIRIDELHALVGAGIVTILPPGMQIKGEKDHFALTTPSDPNFSISAKALIEARVPAVNAPTAENTLLQQLLHDGYAHPYELQLNADKRFQSGAVDVDRKTQQLLGAGERPQAGLYFWGVPTEGVHWLTTASSRPLTDDVNFNFANNIVRNILGIPQNEN